MATTYDEEKRFPLYASLDAARSDLDRMGAQARSQQAAPAPAQPALQPKPAGRSARDIARGFAPGTMATIEGAATDAAAAARGGNYGAAAGQAVRGLSALPVALADDSFGRPVRAVRDAAAPAVAGFGNAAYTFATGDAAPQFGSTPAAATSTQRPATNARPAAAAGAGPAPVGGFNPAQDSQGAYAQPNVRAPEGYTGPQGTAVTDAPGVRKVVDAQGRTLYTNGSVESDAALMGRGPVSAQNMAAADALVARSATAPGQLVSQPAAGQGEVAPAASVIGETGGFGLLDRNRLIAREQQMAAEQAMRGAGSRTRASTYAALTANEANNATARANSAEANATARRGQDLQADAAQARIGVDQQRLGFEGARTAADVAQSRATTADVQTRTQAAMQLMGAQNALLQARQGGDAKAVAAAEENLRALQGKYEREIPDLFSVTPVSGGIDPTTGQPRGAGAVILNKRTGQAQFVTPSEVQGTAAAAKPGTTTKEEYDKLPKGARYVAPDGKTYIKG